MYDIGGFPGMSGGAILDEQGKLVGIHGRATTRPDTNATTVLGIPLKTYLSLAPSVQSVAIAPAPTPISTPKPAPIPPPDPSQPVNSNNLSGKFVLQKTLNGHSSSVNSVAISPDGRTLASGSYDTTIKIWNIATGQEIRTLTGHSGSVYSVAMSPDGRTLASGDGGSIDGTIKIWNIATGQEIRTLKGHPVLVNSVAFSPDGRTLASGSDDKTIKIWRLSK